MVARKIEITETQAERLDALARKLAMSSDTLAATAIEAMLDLGVWQAAEIEAGLKDADAGEFAEPAEIEAILKKYASHS
jgi:RHH-type rel operon transcriptional repressor/antitoxin RelB